ncbi:MAG: GFA family protein [Rhizobiaceae bacterium]|nr:GFA family protein [Rhizobiaceae bacterium]
MAPTTAGSCLCGTVEFQVFGDFESFYFCHCRRYQEVTGSAHSANLFSTTATVNWVSGQEFIQTYHLPDTRFEKSFCKRCGSAGPTAQMEGALLVVPAEIIDGVIDIPPSSHIFFSSRADWGTRSENAPKFAGPPRQVCKR